MSGAQIASFVRPGIGDVEDVRPVALVKMPRLRADQQVQFFAGFELLGHLPDHPRPEPVGARWRLRVLRQQVDRHAHVCLPVSFRTIGGSAFASQPSSEWLP